MDETSVHFFIPVVAQSGYRKGTKRLDFEKKARLFIPNLKPFDRNNRFSVKLQFHYMSECNGDLDNRIKCVMDALQRKCFEDDWQVKHIDASIVEFSDRIGVSVILSRLETRYTADSIKSLSVNGA